MNARSSAAAPASGVHRATKRALELVEYVAASEQAVTLSDLARELDLPKSSAHALVRTLDDEGYLSRDARGAYRLGPRLLRLLGRLPQLYALPRVARPIMQDVVDRISETALLGVRQGRQITYVEQVEGPHFMRYVAPLGEARPMHCTSIGKVCLAAMPQAEAQSLLKSLTLERFTAQTVVSVRSLTSELAEVRARGYALNVNESMSGVAAIAVPVHEGGDPAGRVIAGLSVAGPAERMTPQLEEAYEPLRAAAMQIGGRLQPQA